MCTPHIYPPSVYIVGQKKSREKIKACEMYPGHRSERTERVSSEFSRSVEGYATRIVSRGLTFQACVTILLHINIKLHGNKRISINHFLPSLWRYMGNSELLHVFNDFFYTTMFTENSQYFVILKL